MFTKTLDKPYWHVWSGDPAIDTETTVVEHGQECDKACSEDQRKERGCVEHPVFDFECYCETGDEKYIPLKNGSVPMRFELKHLYGRTLNHARSMFRRSIDDDTFTEIDICFSLVELSLVGCSNVMCDAVEMQIERSLCTDRLERVDPAVMDILYEKPQLVMELGNRVASEDIMKDPLSRKE
jgi:hypothetical protein